MTRRESLRLFNKDAPVLQMLFCDKFEQKIAKRSALLCAECIFLNCNKRKGQVDAVLGCKEICTVEQAEQRCARRSRNLGKQI